MFLGAVITKYSDRSIPFNSEYSTKDSVNFRAQKDEVTDEINFNKCGAGISARVIREPH